MEGKTCIPFRKYLEVEVQGQNVDSVKWMLPQILRLPCRTLHQSTPLSAVSVLHSFYSANTQLYLPLSPLPDGYKKLPHCSIFFLFFLSFVSLCAENFSEANLWKEGD